jgi:heterodisulfide reductase subunit C2
MESDAVRSLVMAGDLDLKFKDEVAAQLGSLDLSYCFQCGVCSGSCPTAERMKYGPRRIMQMIRLGIADEILRSHDMWLCVSCHTCSARCPQGIPVANVMSILRNLSLARGVAKDAEVTFSQVFTDVVTRHGRMFEPELLLRYYAASANLLGVLRQAGLGLTMLRKGKIGLQPERIKNVAELKAIAARLRGERGGAEQ